jgi:uncharacterized repeat protein (TIGR03837 family)
MHIHVYCKVVDNWGDAGFCWRLSRQLAHCGKVHSVQLFVDGLDTFSDMGIDLALAKSCKVSLCDWPSVPTPEAPKTPKTPLPDLLIASFGCDLPKHIRQAISDQAASSQGQQCVWINLEYLSAEPWVESHHWQRSLKPDGALEMFYMPGFTPKTGGILGTQKNHEEVAIEDLLRKIQLPVKALNERWASLFCYPWAPTETLSKLGPSWTILVASSIELTVPKSSETGPKFHQLPVLSQPEYDALLTYCDVNFVRGEESWVRAQWAGKPFIWQPYRQSENTHLTKLHAFVQLVENQVGPQPLWAQAMQQWNSEASVASNAASFKCIPTWMALLAQNPTHESSPFTRWQHYLYTQTTLVERLLEAKHAWTYKG